jgi:hypothetical protein
MPGRGGPTKNFYLPLARKHVMADRWKDEVGTDFWLMPSLLTGTVGDTTAGKAGGNRLFDNGWTFEAEHNVIGSASAFRGGVITAGSPATPGIPTHLAFLATGDIVASPPIFGGYDHMLAAAWCVGKNRHQLPTKLIMECRAAFTVNSANEPTSGFGFFEDATTTTTATEALQLAFISSDSVNFQLATNASSTLVDVGDAISTTWHEWEIVIDYDTAGAIRASWYIDGVLQGSIVPTTNEAPYAFGAHTLSTNKLLLGPVHIYYDW